MDNSVAVELKDLLAMKPGIGKRLRDAFHYEDITTMQQLLVKTRRELMLCPNLGEHSIDALEHALAVRGLHLNDRSVTWSSWWADVLREQT